MKISLSTCALAVAALLAGNAMAGNAPDGAPAKDGPRGIMRADTDGDGKVSKDEAAALHDKKQGDWFDKTDANKDGFLTEDEIQNGRDARRDHMRGEMKARMEQRFKEADANNDGQLSLDEVQAKLPRLADRFNTLDADQNGMLSKDELKRSGSGHRPPQN
ncbi:MAG TPA: hypothetical protein VM146_01620 [Steroidobacteraceae bacterium]|nr:hypothetical protein [Steroidobacteraceae bacterium]